MTGLLLTQPHGYSDRLAAPGSRGFRPRALQRALDVIDRDPAGDLSSARLCTISGVGPRALQRYFRQYVGVTPREYVQATRLRHAHDDLVQGHIGSVTEVELRWSFGHLPRFAAAFRARYGLAPSVILRESESPDGSSRRETD